MKIKSLLRDKVLVERLQMEQTSAAGIILPSGNDNNKFKGTVLMVGPEVKVIKAGDVVKFYEHTGTEVQHDGKDCIILREETEIIARL